MNEKQDFSAGKYPWIFYQFTVSILVRTNIFVHRCFVYLKRVFLLAPDLHVLAGSEQLGALREHLQKGKHALCFVLNQIFLRYCQSMTFSCFVNIFQHFMLSDMSDRDFSISIC